MTRRRRELRSIDDLPLLGRLTRVAIPARPALDAGEAPLLDLFAHRIALELNIWKFLFMPWTGWCPGRLVLTERRLLFRTYPRHPMTWGILKTPHECGSIEVPLPAIESVAHLSWLTRIRTGTFFFGMTAVEIGIVGGAHYRFALPRRPWERATLELGDHYRALLPAEAGR